MPNSSIMGAIRFLSTAGVMGMIRGVKAEIIPFGKPFDTMLGVIHHAISTTAFAPKNESITKLQRLLQGYAHAEESEEVKPLDVPAVFTLLRSEHVVIDQAIKLIAGRVSIMDQLGDGGTIEHIDQAREYVVRALHTMGTVRPSDILEFPIRSGGRGQGLVMQAISEIHRAGLAATICVPGNQYFSLQPSISDIISEQGIESAVEHVIATLNREE